LRSKLYLCTMKERFRFWAVVIWYLFILSAEIVGLIWLIKNIF
jgi:hypothetical protein